MTETKQIREWVEITLRKLEVGITVDDVDLSGAEDAEDKEELIAFAKRQIMKALKAKKPHKYHGPPRRNYIDKRGRVTRIPSPEHEVSLKERLQNHVLNYRARTTH